MTAAEERPELTLYNDLLRMVEKLTTNQEKNKRELEKAMQSMEHRLAVRLDSLYQEQEKQRHLMTGNGDQEAAIITKVRDNRHQIEELSKIVARNTDVLNKLQDSYDKYRNIIIGMGLAFPIITALLVIVLSHVLGIALAP